MTADERHDTEAEVERVTALLLEETENRKMLQRVVREQMMTIEIQKEMLRNQEMEDDGQN